MEIVKERRGKINLNERAKLVSLLLRDKNQSKAIIVEKLSERRSVKMFLYTKNN